MSGQQKSGDSSNRRRHKKTTTTQHVDEASRKDGTLSEREVGRGLYPSLPTYSDDDIQMEVDEHGGDVEQRREASSSVRSRKKSKENISQHPQRIKNTNNESGNRVDELSESVEKMKLEGRKNIKDGTLEYYDHKKSSGHGTNSGYAGHPSSDTFSDESEKGTVTNKTSKDDPVEEIGYASKGKRATQTDSKHRKKGESVCSQEFTSDGGGVSTGPKTGSDKTKQKRTSKFASKDGNDSNSSANSSGGGKHDNISHGHDLANTTSKNTSHHKTGSGQPQSGTKRGSTPGNSISRDAIGRNAKTCNRSSSSSSRSSITNQSDSKTGNRCQCGSRSQSGGSRSSSACTSESASSRSTSRSTGSRHSRTIAVGRSVGGTVDNRSIGSNRSSSTSSSDAKEHHTRPQAYAGSSGDDGTSQQASKGHGTVKDKKETGISKQGSSSKSKTVKKSNDSDSYSSSDENAEEKYVCDSKKKSETRGKPEKDRKRSSSDKRSGAGVSSVSKKEKKSKKKDKSKARNESKHRNKLHINDKDEEERNENIGRSTRSSEILPAKSPIQYKWQYEDDHGWTTYGQIPSTRNSSGAKTATSDDIERHYLDAEDDCPLVIEVRNVEYLLDFKELTQTNKWTKMRRNIRRIHKHTADDHSILGQTNYSRNSSEKTYCALGYGDVTIPHDRPNNYSKYRSSDTLTNDFSVKHVWQFEDELGNWVTYGKTNSRFGGKKATTSEDIEKVFAKDPSRAIMRIHGKNHQYILDFRKRTQTNEETQVQRRVRRVPENSARTSLVEQIKPTAGSLVGSGKEFINFEWQFMDEHGQWITYGQINSAGKSAFVTTTTSDDIEKFFSSAPKKLMTIKSRTNSYVLNFLDMTQTNETTSVVRPIRRIPKFSRENKPQNNVGHAVYRNITQLNLASSNPNSTPSYGITPSHGGSWSTTGQGSGSSDYGRSGGGRGAGFNDYGQGGGGGREAGFNNYGQGGGGGRGAGFDDYGEGEGNRRSGFSDYGQGGRGAGFNNYGQGGGGRGVGSNDYYGRGAGNTPGQSVYGNTFKWQFQDENGLWITYGQTSSTGFVKGKTSASSDDIERHCARTSGQPLTISSPMGDYVLDFANMIQSNVTTRTKKNIRRVSLNFE